MFDLACAIKHIFFLGRDWSEDQIEAEQVNPGKTLIFLSQRVSLDMMSHSVALSVDAPFISGCYSLRIYGWSHVPLEGDDDTLVKAYADVSFGAVPT